MREHDDESSSSSSQLVGDTQTHQARQTAPPAVDAAVHLIRSLSSSASTSSAHPADTPPPSAVAGTSSDPSPELLPLVRRILTAYSTTTTSAASADLLASNRRRLERSLRSTGARAGDRGGRGGGSSRGGGGGRDDREGDEGDPVRRQRIERTANRTLARVDTLHRQLIRAEERHRSLHGGSSGSSGGLSSEVADGILVVLSRLVGTKHSVPRGGRGVADLYHATAAGEGTMTSERGTREDRRAAASSSSRSSASQQGGGAVSSSTTPARSGQARSVLHEEAMLLRDCLFALQGVDSERIKSYQHRHHHHHPRYSRPSEKPTAHPMHDAAVDCEGIRINPSLSPFHSPLSVQIDIRSDRLLGAGSMDAMRICGEAAFLYGRVKAYVDGVRDNNGGGVGANNGSGSGGGGAVSRALASALSAELSEYHRLIAVLEAQLSSEYDRSNFGVVDNGRDRVGEGSSRLGERLTLRRLLLHLRPATSRLRTLAALTDSLHPTPTNNSSFDSSLNSRLPYLYSGGNLIATLSANALHGDTRHSDLVHSLTAQSCRPWFDMLWGWTTDGTLPYGQSFIPPQSSSASAITTMTSGVDCTSSECSSGSGEFFVGEDLSASDSDLWHGRYVLHRDGVPAGVLSMELAQLALVVGKGINFIRKCLGDAGWEVDLVGAAGHGGSDMANPSHQVQGRVDYGGYNDDGRSNDSEANLRARLGYRYVPPSPSGVRTSSPLTQTLNATASQVNAHILQSLNEVHHLPTHLWALKQFLLLGRGDFVSALLDGMHRELDNRPSDDARRVGSGEMDGVYVHTLMSVLENALRTTNARYLPGYVLGRLRVELSQKNQKGQGRASSSSSGRDQVEGQQQDQDEEQLRQQQQARPDAWDAFSLAYDIDAPLTAIVHPRAMCLYKKVFGLLFRLKRIVYMLNRTWRQSTALHHALRQLAVEFPVDEAAAAAAAEAKEDGGDATCSGSSSSSISRERTAHLLRRVSLTRQSILHFASNLQSYLMFDVVEGGYKEMSGRMAGAKTLDEVIAAHDLYLEEIVQKSLLDDVDDDDDGNAGNADGSIHNGENSQEQETPGQDSPSSESPSLGSHLAKVLDVSLRFCHVHSKLFATALQSVDVASRKRRTAERRAKSGKWGYDMVDEDVDGTKLFGSLSDQDQMRKVEGISDEFDAALDDLVSALDRELNNAPVVQTTLLDASVVTTPDSSFRRGAYHYSTSSRRHHTLNQANNDSLRFLAFRLDFNEYYNKNGKKNGGG